MAKYLQHCIMLIVCILSTAVLSDSISAPDSQSMSLPATVQAQGIYSLWWVMLIVASVIFCLVMMILIIGVFKNRHTSAKQLNFTVSRNLVIAGGIAIPLLTVICLVGGSLLLGRDLSASPPEDSIKVRITGKMWWWEIEYLNAENQVVATTANELHVPVGKAVHVLLESDDVIHSFWVPKLHGKTDMIPGRTNSSWFTVDRPGTFRGQCAEFCGKQHARMSFLVIAEKPEAFNTWLENQALPAPKNLSISAMKGQEVFFGKQCASCHTIKGTIANGKLGPDLTHIASRQSLASVTRPNNRGHLAGWISDPQSTKPGAKMSRTLMTSAELNNLIDYLESLK